MDTLALANLLFPNVTQTAEDMETMFPERNLPEGAVVTLPTPSTSFNIPFSE